MVAYTLTPLIICKEAVYYCTSVQRSLFGLHIHCFNLFFGIRRPLSIHSAIVINLNLSVSSTRSPCTFTRNLKLSQDPTNRQFVARSLIHRLLVEVIPLSFFLEYIIKTRETKVIEEIDCVGGVKIQGTQK